MKINSVHLKNYRKHEDERVEFTDGINLLIGKNGSGKSSILEAIGLAMFGANTRTGKLQDAVTLGKKRGSIEIEFEGNDGIVYVLKRGIGSTSSAELYEKDNPVNSTSGIKEIGEKVGVLCGIESENIYDNVVTAGQNQIVGIFTKNTVAARKGQRPEIEDVFNKIFDTEIYREIYSKFSQKSMERYKNGVDRLSGEKELVKENMGDIEEIKTGIAAFEAVIAEHNGKLAEIKKAMESQESRLEDGRKLEKEIDLLAGKIESSEKLLSSKKEELDGAIKSVETAEEASRLCSENRENHDNYRECKEKLTPLEARMREFETVKEAKLELEKGIMGKQKAIGDIGAEIKIAESGIEADTAKLSENKDTLAGLEEKLEKIKLEKKAVSEKLEKLRVFKIEYKTELDKLWEKQEARRDLAKTIKNLEGELAKYDLDSIEEEERVIDSSISRLDGKLAEKAAFMEERSKLEAMLENNTMAKEKLSDSICPYFNDRCQNLASSNLDPATFFSQREAELKEKIDELSIKLTGYGDLDGDKQGIVSEKARLEDRKKDQKDKSSDLAVKLENLKLQDEVIASLEKLMEKISEGAPVKGDNFDETFKKLEIEEGVLVQQEGAFKIGELESELAGTRDKIVSIQNGVEAKREELSVKLATLENLKDEKGGLESRQEELSGKLVGMDELKAEIAGVKESMASYEEGHNIYMQNLSASEKLGAYQEKQKSLESGIEKVAEELGQHKKSHQEKTSIFDKDLYEEIAGSIAELRETEKGIHKKIGESESALEELKKKKSKHKEDSKRLKEISQQISKLNKKIALTDKFRGNINTMGKMVADSWIKNIALKATENFRDITGRPEQIDWINNEKESFAVYLTDGKGMERKFTILSGGEQVAVALSIRAAMATLMSDANFSIFDEPTNNLDMERKLALADSMDKILKGCRQNIIVTHDDTFREMAQNVIEIDKN